MRLHVIQNSLSFIELDSLQRHVLLRSILSIVLLCFSVWQIATPADFVKFLVIQDLTPIPDQALIVAHGICIGISAAFLLSGHKPRLAAAIVALLLTLIVLHLAMHGLQFIGELLRNLVLIGSALVLMADPVKPPKLIWTLEDNQKKVQDESEKQI